MLLRFDQLEAHLAHARTHGLSLFYVVMGDEMLLVQEVTDALRILARQQGIHEREIYTVERQFNWDILLDAAQSISLFGDRKLLELRIPSGKPGREGGEALKHYVSLQADQTDTITFISLPRLDAATQKSAWFVRLEQLGVVFRIDPVERQALPRWIELRLQRQKQRVPAGEIGRRMLGFIADKVEGNLLAAHQEINKLALLYPEGELSEEDVQQAVLNVARYDVFKLSEAILAGNLARTVRMLNGLEGEGEAPVLVLWALTEEIRTMQRVLALQQEGKPWGTITRELRIWGARERILPKALPRFTIERLNAALMIAADIDTLIKGLKPSALPAEPCVALQELALELAR